MALTVEDGTGVPGANSYVTVAEIRAWATARGHDLPDDDVTVEQFAVRSTDWTETFREEYQSRKTTTTQPLQFPRQRVVVDRTVYSNSDIPVELKNAQMQAIVDQALGTALQPTGNAQVKKEKVDSIEVEYFESNVGTLSTTSGSPAALKILEPLFYEGVARIKVLRA